jgi:hypothetical protein
VLATLLDILDGKKPSYMNVNEANIGWFRTYMTGTEEEIVSKLALMFDGIE